MLGVFSQGRLHVVSCAANCGHDVLVSAGRTSIDFVVHGEVHTVVLAECAWDSRRFMPREAVDWLELALHRKIVNATQASYLMHKRGVWVSKWKSFILPIHRHQTWNDNGTYYLLRDLVRVAKCTKVRCEACKKLCHRCNATISVYEWTACSEPCAARLLERFERWQRQQLEQQSWYKKERQVIRLCKAQLKALRSFLKNGNLEALRLLPEEYGPAKTSPASCRP